MEPYVHTKIELENDDRQYIRTLVVPNIADTNSALEWYKTVKTIIDRKRLNFLESRYAEFLNNRQRIAETCPSRDTKNTASETATIPLTDIVVYKALFASRLTDALLFSWADEYIFMRDWLPDHEEPYNLFEVVEAVREYITLKDPFNPQIQAELKRSRRRTEPIVVFLRRFMFYYNIHYDIKTWTQNFRHSICISVLEAHTKNFPTEIEAFKHKLEKKMSNVKSVQEILDILGKYAPRHQATYSGKRSNLDYMESTTVKKTHTDSGTSSRNIRKKRRQT